MGMQPQLSTEPGDATSHWSVPECPKIFPLPLPQSWCGSSLFPVRFGNVLMLLSLPSALHDFIPARRSCRLCFPPSHAKGKLWGSVPTE